MPNQAAPRTLATWELVGLVASLSALNALGVDVMLPALPEIGRDFALAEDNSRQLVVVVYIIAFGIGQFFYGPLSDAIGRRGVLVGALGLYIGGSALCVAAPSFEWFLAARVLQGFGAAATRVVSFAVVRDLTSGRRMAQIVSAAMSVFMLVPILAPGIGQLILFVAPWRWLFGVLLIYALVVLAWAMLRLPETLPPEKRSPFRLRAIAASYAVVLRDRQCVGYTLAATLVTGGMFGYVASCEQIFVETYDLGAAFPLAFAAIAICMSASSYFNARWVMRYGMRRLSQAATIWLVGMASVHALWMATAGVALPLFLVLLALTFAVFGMLTGNFNALSLERMGARAGTAQALFGAVTAFGGGVIGAAIARQYDGTALPFLIGLSLLGAATLLVLTWIERGRLFQEPPQTTTT